MNNYKNIITLSSMLLFSSMSSAALVDLTSWEHDGGGTWNVQAGNDSVLQSQNGQPTVFFEDSSNARGTSISGSIEVNSSSDDDFIGFVLGYQNDELQSNAADYWLIDWKKGNQSGALAGLALSHVTDGSITNSFWVHTAGAVDEIARATNLGSTGWVLGVDYDFDIVHTASLIEVKVNNVVELSVTAAAAGVAEFTDGAYGFYNYSQNNVLYAGIEEAVIVQPPASVPEPSSLAIFALGFAGLFARRFKK